MKIEVREEPDVSDEVLASGKHSILLRSDPGNGDVYIECATREALLEFAKSLIWEAVHGSGEAEYYPLGQDGRWLVVNGARLAEKSSRLFLSYPNAALGSNHSLQGRRP